MTSSESWQTSGTSQCRWAAHETVSDTFISVSFQEHLEPNSKNHSDQNPPPPTSHPPNGGLTGVKCSDSGLRTGTAGMPRDVSIIWRFVVWLEESRDKPWGQEDTSETQKTRKKKLMKTWSIRSPQWWWRQHGRQGPPSGSSPPATSLALTPLWMQANWQELIGWKLPTGSSAAGRKLEERDFQLMCGHWRGGGATNKSLIKEKSWFFYSKNISSTKVVFFRTKTFFLLCSYITIKQRYTEFYNHLSCNNL